MAVLNILQLLCGQERARAHFLDAPLNLQRLQRRKAPQTERWARMMAAVAFFRRKRLQHWQYYDCISGSLGVQLCTSREQTGFC